VNSSRTYDNDLLLCAARGETLPRPPVWLMRQAGRTDPEYNALKERANKPLEALFRDPVLATEISLLPKRIGVDAIIYFQDILTPLSPMGCDFVFRPGPVTETPIRTHDDVLALKSVDVAESLGFIGETFERIYDALDDEMPVLGFAGAPLTLAVFMIEGGSFGESAPKAMQFFDEQPIATRELLDRLTNMTIDYLSYQIAHGAAAVQLFESAAYLLSSDQYLKLALPTHQRIFEALRGKAPTIMFAREWDTVADVAASGADVVSLPSSISIADARDIIGDGHPVQGNLDNRLLAEGSWDEIEAAARACIESGQRRGHIFNLSHGLLKHTPFEHVRKLVQLVKNS
jgi:uroporphyrinogen decarboxylase